MRLRIALVALCMCAPALAAQGIAERCDTIVDDRDRAPTLYGDLPVDTIALESLPPTTYSPNGVVTCRILVGGLSQPAVLYRREDGTDGAYTYSIQYSRRASGTVKATVSGETLWVFDCAVDAITDARSCLLSRDDLYIHYYGDDTWIVGVGTSHMPGTTVLLRIDDDPALSAPEPLGFEGEEAASIVARLMQGPRIRTRYARFPSGVPESDFRADAFPLAVKIMRWVFDHLRPL
ncbi:MAG TPA: hypothetical protein VNZ57_12745 [Longimicrobiales bacterium]|nr:hypothetical protein [Longimicrobiales bacterium]